MKRVQQRIGKPRLHIETGGTANNHIGKRLSSSSNKQLNRTCIKNIIRVKEKQKLPQCQRHAIVSCNTSILIILRYYLHARIHRRMFASDFIC